MFLPLQPNPTCLESSPKRTDLNLVASILFRIELRIPSNRTGVASSSRFHERGHFLLLSQRHVTILDTLQSMSISSSWVDCCPPTGLTVLVWSASSFSFLSSYLSTSSTGIDTQLWMDFGSSTSLTVLVECLVLLRPNKTFFDLLCERLFTHGSLLSWLLGFWFLVAFVGCPCCFQLLLNPILSSNYLWKKSLEEAEVTHLLSRLLFLQIPSQQLLRYNKLGVCRKGWLHYISCDRIHPLRWACCNRPNTAFLGVLSTSSACTMQDVVWSSQARTDLCVPCPWDSRP